MFGRKTIKKLLLLVLLAGLLPATQAFSAQPDVRLVVDISGSMKRTDPNNLRIPATNLLIDLLPAESKAGIWTFGAYVNMLVAHGDANDAWRNNARNQAKKINSVALFTDIENAIERSSWDVNKPDANTEKHIILLSDGLIDNSEAKSAEQREAENQKSRDHLLRVIVPKLAKAGYTIHTLALSDEADHDLMATMAQRTGGLHAIAYEAKDLMPLLLQIINRLVPSEEVPLQNNRFLIDPTIDEFTLLVFHGAGASVSLHNPAGETFDSSSSNSTMRWHGNSRYTMITVKKPAAGEWYIETPEHPDNRVTVISDIRFHSTSLPPTIYRGYPQKVEAWFTEEGKLIDRREFLTLLDVKATNQKSAELLGKFAMPLAASKPHYQFTFKDFPKLGEQTLKIEVDGRTFLRQVTHSFNVQDVVAASLQLPDDGSSPRVILRAQHPDLKPGDVNFDVRANAEQLAAEYRGDGEWKVDLSSLDRSVTQTIKVVVETKQKKTPVSIELPELILSAEEQAGTPSVIPNPAPQVIPSPVIPIEAPTSPNEVTEGEVEIEVEEPLEEVEEETPEESTETSLFDPIESWDDPRMPWIYISLGIANIILFLVAFLMYRSFINKRKKRQKSAEEDEPEPLLSLDDSLDDALDEFGEDDER
ncbi:VWA domain-containing protein [Marinospirillum insulare]|uniref:VWFA domain-containing protein n=1 Tax=Marinospirillum insulare TaxID=217169 RepID=A0ABQ5ZX29_9GAMM|nr:vWA domain-containing protein [Marinospirillum insulare]GLR62902.1 hypothetical protein GCM10007878_03370 [Marinospirillum insulare]